MNTTAFLVIFTIIELFGFATLAIVVYVSNKALKLEREKLNDNLIQNLGLFFDGLKRKDEQQKIVIEEITKQNDILKEQYEALDEAYDHMNERYMEICEHYSKLLSCWGGVEERYSDCYEQLKYQNERFDRIERYFEAQGQLAWYPEVYPMGPFCAYNNDGKCQNENYPAIFENKYCMYYDPRMCPCNEPTVKNIMNNSEPTVGENE